MANNDFQNSPVFISLRIVSSRAERFEHLWPKCSCSYWLSARAIHPLCSTAVLTAHRTNTPERIISRCRPHGVACSCSQICGSFVQKTICQCVWIRRICCYIEAYHHHHHLHHHHHFYLLKLYHNTQETVQWYSLWARHTRPIRALTVPLSSHLISTVINIKTKTILETVSQAAVTRNQFWWSALDRKQRMTFVCALSCADCRTDSYLTLCVFWTYAVNLVVSSCFLVIYVRLRACVYVSVLIEEEEEFILQTCIQN